MAMSARGHSRSASSRVSTRAFRMRRRAKSVGRVGKHGFEGRHGALAVGRQDKRAQLSRHDRENRAPATVRAMVPNEHAATGHPFYLVAEPIFAPQAIDAPGLRD